MDDDNDIQGVLINYFYICKRKLWFFAKGITMESNYDRVEQGKLLHENSYKRDQQKDIRVGSISIDRLSEEYIKEVKITSKMEKADMMQLFYYIYYLKRLGIEKKGLLNYVTERRCEEVILTIEVEKELECTIKEIYKIKLMEDAPEKQSFSYCSKCAYYELCYISEVN